MNDPQIPMNHLDLVQISKKTGQIKRVPRGEEPVIELSLYPYQHVVQVELSVSILSRTRRGEARKTVDWNYTVWIATRLSPGRPINDQRRAA